MCLTHSIGVRQYATGLKGRVLVLPCHFHTVCRSCSWSSEGVKEIERKPHNARGLTPLLAQTCFARTHTLLTLRAYHCRQQCNAMRDSLWWGRLAQQLYLQAGQGTLAPWMLPAAAQRGEKEQVKTFHWFQPLLLCPRETGRGDCGPHATQTRQGTITCPGSTARPHRYTPG